MEKTQVELIRECLSGSRTVFHYAPESYALQLLKDYIGNDTAKEAATKAIWDELEAALA